MSKIYTRLCEAQPVRGRFRSIIYRMNWDILLFWTAFWIIWAYIGWVLWGWKS